MADLVMGAVPSIIAKLKELLKEEYKLQTDVKRRISSLTDELESVQAALRKVAEEPEEYQLDEQVQTWARQVREASYDMEDRIDTFLVSVDGCRREPIDATGCWWLKRAKNKMGDLPTSKARARADIASTIEDIMKQLQELHERRRGWYFRSVTSTTSTVDPRLPALYRNERELVGIEEARKELVTLLTEGDAEDDKKREVKVVSIVGLAGVGKTTLAKAVYNRLLQVEEQFEQFNCSAFVSVSRNPDLKKVFRDILLELDKPKYQHITIMDENQWVDVIREFLRDKRYLIVIDDIWDKRCWEAIKLALCDGGHGSRIITTTRKYDIAANVSWANYYRLKPLSHDNSKNLFKKRIFGGEGNCPDTKLPGECDKILKKCGGLPLAIITVASVLASQPREKWSEVYNSVALTQQSNRYVDNMRRVLSFSFYDLPLHLRTCLSHLSIYPENCFIEKDFLIWKWVAEGFLDFDHRRDMVALFEIGERYFHDLVNSSMIQIAQEGGVYGCRVHPVLLSHIRVISSEEDFCSVLDDEHHTSPGSSNSRRIVMHSIRNVERNIIPEVNMNMGKVRSFNASLCFIDGIPQLSRFQVLRVLALEYCLGIDTHHLKQIGNLVHLRYLGLVGAGVLDLPDEALGGLRLLQTLDMRETDIERWPRTISIQPLMCLCVRRTRLVPEDIGCLSSLEDLRLHHVSGDSVNMAKEMSLLQRLRVLEIGFEKMDAELKKVLMGSIGQLEGLRSLMLMAAANGEQEHHSITLPYLKRLNIFSTNMAVIFQGPGATMPKLEQIEFRVRVAQIEEAEEMLVSLSSLKKVTVVLDCRGASAAEMEEAEEMLGRAIAGHPNSPQLEVTKENGNNEVLLIDQFRFRNPRLEDLRSEMEKMQANQQVQVQPDNGSDEIVPAEVDSATS